MFPNYLFLLFWIGVNCLKEGPRHFHNATFGTSRLVEEVPLYPLTRFGSARFSLARLCPP